MDRCPKRCSLLPGSVDRTAHQANRLAGELVTVVEALRAAGVRTLALKGPALATLLDGSPALRAGRTWTSSLRPRTSRRRPLSLRRWATRLDRAQTGSLVSCTSSTTAADSSSTSTGTWPAQKFPLRSTSTSFGSSDSQSRSPVPRLICRRCLGSPCCPCLYLIKEYPRVELRYLADLEFGRSRLSPAELSRTGEIARPPVAGASSGWHTRCSSDAA